MQQYPPPQQPMGGSPPGQPYGQNPYGQLPYGQPGSQIGQGPKTNTLAIVGLILGILTLTIGWCMAGPLFGIGGTICSFIALNQINKSVGAEKGKGIAIAGLVSSAGGLVLMVLAIVFVIVFGMADEVYEVVDF